MPVVDCQVHLHARTYFEAHVGRLDPPRAERRKGGYVFHTSEGRAIPIPTSYCEVEERMEELQAHSVDVVVSSMGAFNVDHMPVTQAMELAMQLNEECAELERRYPSRYHWLALLPMQDARAAIETLEHAVRTLRLRGVCICSNVNGESMAAPARSAIYRRIEELGIPVFVHPTAAMMERRPRRYTHEHTITSMVEVCIAALEEIFSGVLDRHPTLRVVHPHLGGVLPRLASHVDYEGAHFSSGSQRVNRPPSERLRRLYTDTVSTGPRALRLAAKVHGPDHLLYASDYPYRQPAAGLELVRNEFEGDALDRVLSGNAASLLGLGGARAPWGSARTPALRPPPASPR